jgi:hypothetical protein
MQYTDGHDDHWTYYGFGYKGLPHQHTKEAVGATCHARLGGTRYYLQVGTLSNQIWREVDRDEWDAHLKPIAS